MIISFVSLKGGVGKTMVSLETACALANDFGKKVLLIDGNFSAPNIGLYLDLEQDVSLHDVLSDEEGLHAAIYGSFGIDVVPSSLYFKKNIDPYKLKNVLEKYKSRYDFIIIDSSPHHTEMLPAIVASEKVFVVTTPDRVTMHTTLKAALSAKKNSLPVEGVIINRISDSRFELDLEEIQKSMELPVLARIRNHNKIIEANHFKSPITILDSRNEISREIKRFAAALAGHPPKKSIWNKIFRNHLKKEVVNLELMRNSFYTPSINLS